MQFLLLNSNQHLGGACCVNSNCLSNVTAFHLKDTNVIIVMLSFPTMYLQQHFIYLFVCLRVTKAMHFCTVTLLWHTVNFTSPHTVKPLLPSNFFYTEIGIYIPSTEDLKWLIEYSIHLCSFSLYQDTGYPD